MEIKPRRILTLNTGRTYSTPKFKTGLHSNNPPRMLRKGLTGKQEMRKRKVLQSLDLKKIRDEIIAEDANMKVKDHTLTR